MFGVKYVSTKYQIMRLLEIDELKNIDKKRRKEANRRSRSWGYSAVGMVLRYGSHTFELDQKYDDIIRKRLIKYMNAKNISEIDMVITPDIVGIYRDKKAVLGKRNLTTADRYDIEHAFFNKHLKKVHGKTCLVYESLVPGYEFQLRFDGAFIVRT